MAHNKNLVTDIELKQLVKFLSITVNFNEMLLHGLLSEICVTNEMRSKDVTEMILLRTQCMHDLIQHQTCS